MSARFISQVGSYLPPKNLLPLLIGYSIDHIALSTYWIFFGIWLNDNIIQGNENLTYPYLILAVILATPAIVSIIGTSVFSSISDKIGRRKEIMFISRVLLMAQYIILIFFGNSTLNVLLILGTFGLFTQMFYTMHSALLTSICHPDKRGQVSSFQVLFASFGWMIGSGVSSLIYNSFDIAGSLVFAAGFALLAGVIVMFSPAKSWNHKELKQKSVDLDDFTIESEIPIISELKEKDSTQIKKDITKLRTAEEIAPEKKKSASSYWQIFKRRDVLSLLITLAIVDFGFGPFNVVGNVFLKRVGLSDGYISAGNVIATFLGMILLLFIGKALDKRGRRPIFIISIITYPILYGLMYLLTSFPNAIFVLYLYPLYALKVPTSNAIMSDLTSENERARGMSLIQFEQIIFANVGAFLACFIADIVPQELFIIPLFPFSFGIVAVIVAFLIMKETDKKILIKRKINSEPVS
ncbi:MAG: MFS transporter [Candidatus Heimdallarchaeota archaeon]